MTRPTIDEIIYHSALVTGADFDVLRGGGRVRAVSKVRQNIYAIGRLLGYTNAQIAVAMSIDHSTVCAGAKKAMAEDSYKATRLRILASLEARAPIVARLELVLDGDGECSIVGDVPLEWTDVVVDMLESYAMSLKGRRSEDFEKPRDCDVVLQ